MQLPPKMKKRLELSGRLILALAMLFSTFYIASMLARALAGWLAESTIQKIAGIPIEAGVATIGVTFIISSLQQILTLLKNLHDYVFLGEPVKLFPDYLALGGIVAVVALLDGIAPGGMAPPTTESTPPEIVYLAPKPPPPEALATFPLLFDDLASGPEKGWDRGVTLGEEQKAALEKLMTTLEACIGEKPNENVVIRVRGAADFNEFKLNGTRHPNSDEYNRQAANLRGKAVHTVLERLRPDIAGPSHLEIEPFRPWPTFAAMKASLPYYNRQLLDTGKDQGYLNRRAEVLLIRAGVCERLYEERDGAPSTPPRPSPEVEDRSLAADSSAQESLETRQARNLDTDF